MALLRDLRDRTGLTVLLVEQNVAQRAVDRRPGVVMALGRVVAADDARPLRGDDDLRCTRSSQQPNSIPRTPAATGWKMARWHAWLPSSAR